MILRRNLLVLGTAAAVMLRTKPGASIIQDGATAIGPAASGSFINVDFINRTSKVIARELFGVSTATMLDFNFALCNNTSFQIASRSLNVPLLRFNCNSGSSGGNVWANLFANGPRGRPDWSVIAPLINNLWKIVDLTKCKIIMGFGGTSGAATDTNGWSVTDFAHALTVVVNHMRTTPGGDGKPINPKYWEIMNEPGISAATYNSYFNACADAVHAIDPTYVVTGPCSPNDAGRVGSLIAATNATRLGLPNWHVYLHCPGIDPVPSNLQIARALTGGAGTDPVGFANGINSLSSGNFTANLPWFCGEYNIGLRPFRYQRTGAEHPRRLFCRVLVDEDGGDGQSGDVGWDLGIRQFRRLGDNVRPQLCHRSAGLFPVASLHGDAGYYGRFSGCFRFWLGDLVNRRRLAFGHVDREPHDDDQIGAGGPWSLADQHYGEWHHPSLGDQRRKSQRRCVSRYGDRWHDRTYFAPRPVSRDPVPVTRRGSRSKPLAPIALDGRKLKRRSRLLAGLSRLVRHTVLHHARVGSVMRRIVPVVLWPCCNSTSNTMPPQLRTSSAPTTSSIR